MCPYSDRKLHSKLRCHDCWILGLRLGSDRKMKMCEFCCCPSLSKNPKDCFELNIQKVSDNSFNIFMLLWKKIIERSQLGGSHIFFSLFLSYWLSFRNLLKISYQNILEIQKYLQEVCLIFTTHCKILFLQVHLDWSRFCVFFYKFDRACICSRFLVVF